jgi:tetratricopeptide (TPR) repeat protein
MIVFIAWSLYWIAAALRFQSPGPAPPKPDIAKLRQQADALFSAGKLLEALPLYEQLEKRDPSQAMFAERRAAGLIAKSATQPRVAEQLALEQDAYAELLRAKSLGDNSTYVVTLLEKMKQLFQPAEPSPGLSAAAQINQGRAAQAKGDYRLALQHYAAAAQADPRSYDAAVRAGEAAGYLKDTQGAGLWFNKAIAIDPRRDTAFREWGSMLLNANQFEAAKDRFISGIVAWPYALASWQGLQEWAEKTHAHLSSPRINRPLVTERFDPSAFREDGTGRSAWIPYVMARLNYRNVPNYRHTLVEEVACLKQAAEAVKAAKIPAAKVDPNLNALLVLYGDQMLEPWILLHGPDDDIVKDYPAYRDAHRDQISAYINKYDIQIRN